MKSQRQRFRFAAILLLTVPAIAAILAIHAVDNRLSDEDRRVIPRYLTGVAPLPAAPDYAAQLRFIGAVQAAVLAIAPGAGDGLPFDHTREPKDLLEAGSGLCYDRSRAIEKVLRSAGLETRHLALFAIPEGGSALDALLKPGVDSHAVTEVLTRAGWLVVDSNHHWLSLDAAGRPVSIATIARTARGKSAVDWRQPPPAGIYNRPFVSVIGLYSRHGRFYPPYDRIPDVNYGELLQNLTGGPR